MEGRTRRISRTGGGAALRALLALVLAIGLMPTVPSVAFANEQEEAPDVQPSEGAIATVNGKECGSIQSVVETATSEAQAGAEVTIVLLQNVEGTTGAGFVIPDEMIVSLDLNGNDLIGKNAGSWIVNRGTLAIYDSEYNVSGGQDGGHVYTTNTEDQGRHAIENYGTLTINGGFFGDKNSNKEDDNDVQRGNAVRNFGTATIEGGSFTCCDNYTGAGNGFAYAIANGSESHPDASMTINNATVYGSVNGLIASDGGTLTVNGGSYALGDGMESNLWRVGYTSGTGVIEINGGTFTKNVASNDHGFFGGAQDSFYINNGTFESECGESTDIYFDSGSAVISGGTFKGQISTSEFSSVEAVGGTFEQGLGTATTPSGMKFDDSTKKVVRRDDAAASIGQAAYASIGDAIDAADGETIVLLRDVVESVTIPDSVEVTLDLNGCTITNAGNKDKGDHTITNYGTLTVDDLVGGGVVDNVTHGRGALVNYGTVTVEDGTFTRSAEASKSPTDNGGNSWYVINNQKDMTFNGGSVTSKGEYSSLIRNLNGTLTINDGTFSNGFIALKNDTGGTLRVNGGTITSGDQAVQNWNDAKLTGGKFNGSVISWAYNSDTGSTVIGGQAVINGEVRATTFKDSTTKAGVFISGGTVNGQIQKGIYNNGTEIVGAESKDSTITVTGGTISDAEGNEAALKEFMPSGFVAGVGADSLSVVPRKGLPAGTYITSSKDGEITSNDLQSGLTVSKDEDGNYVVSRPYVPPVVEPSYDVTVGQVENGSVTVDPKAAKEGDEVTVTVKPDEGFELASLVVADEDGNALKLELSADGTYSFTMPAGDVTVHASFADAWENPFTDLGEDHWGYGAVRTANLLGLMKGYEGTTLFGPDDGLMREQAATVMWNLIGDGDVSRPEAPQADVDQSQWYAPYVNWAVDSKVMDGYSEDDFGVGDSLTREQFAAVVAKAVGADVDSADQAALGAFPDADGVSGWARATMAWAVENGVINGVETEDGSRELQSTRELTRAEMATMMVNAIEVGVLDFGA